MKRHKIIMLLSLMLFSCLVFSTVISLFSMRQISQEHTTDFLQVLSNDIYHSVSDELTDTINNARLIANDSLLIDLLEREEELDQNEIEDKITSYTALLKNEFSYSWVFIVSDQSKAYYSDQGIYRFIDPVNEEEDVWYDDFLSMDKQYDVSIGQDNDVPDNWTIFVDARIENEDGDFLGVCGMALEFTDLQERIRDYEEQYNIKVLFVDENGNTQLESGNIQDDLDQLQILPEQMKDDQITAEKSLTSTSYTITKYIDELDWYMVIENIKPYNYMADYMVIGLNVAVFVAFLIIIIVSLHFIFKNSRTLLFYSYYDNLTGLFNRRAFDDHMSTLREQDCLGNLYLAAFDVNGLKKINDSMGHLAGDELIAGGAHIIQKVFGPYGKCYRTGGDEFVAILEEPVQNIHRLIEQFEKNISEWHGEQIETISISYGIACASDKDSTIDELICHADEQMYHQKKAYYRQRKNNRREEEEKEKK